MSSGSSNVSVNTIRIPLLSHSRDSSFTTSANVLPVSRHRTHVAPSLSRCLHSIVSVFILLPSQQGIEQASNHLGSLQTGVIRSLSSWNQSLSFRTSINLPFAACCKKKGTPV